MNDYYTCVHCGNRFESVYVLCTHNCPGKQYEMGVDYASGSDWTAVTPAPTPTFYVAWYEIDTDRQGMNAMNSPMPRDEAEAWVAYSNRTFSGYVRHIVTPVDTDDALLAEINSLTGADIAGFAQAAP